MHELDVWEVILTPLFNCGSLSHSQGRSPVLIVYNVDGVSINFCIKKLETPSLTALTPSEFSTVPVHNLKAPSKENNNSHTIVRGNEWPQCAFLIMDVDQPSYRSRHPKGSGPTDTLRIALSRPPINSDGKAGLLGLKEDARVELPPKVT
jgi:hypothetical protein